MADIPAIYPGRSTRLFGDRPITLELIARELARWLLLGDGDWLWKCLKVTVRLPPNDFYEVWPDLSDGSQRMEFLLTPDDFVAAKASKEGRQALITRMTQAGEAWLRQHPRPAP